MSWPASLGKLGLTAALAVAVPSLYAGDFSIPNGQILGEVRSVSGIAQLGAIVRLYNRYDQPIREAITNEQGRFGFASLPSDLYSVRVTLASFMPALRRNIEVSSGSDYLLRINLANVLSTVEVLPGPTSGTILSDDWKWVLRSSSATRPVLRILPELASNRATASASLFSQTTGMVRVSAGDGESFGGGTQQDMGTGFSVESNLRDAANVRFSGNFGHMGQAGTQSAGFRTTYTSRQSGAQVSLTARQAMMPSLAGSGTGDSSPVLRTASLSISDHTDIDALRLDYGINLETVSYLRRVMAASPFARASYDLGSDGMLRAAFSAGTRPAQLISKDGQIDGVDYNADLAALALLPRVSRRDRHMRMERLKAFELGWERSSGSRKFSANVYREEIADAAFTLSGAQGPALWTDLLPDLDSRSFVFNAGDLYRTGFEGAFTQSFGENIDITAAAGRGGALVSSGQDAGSSRASDIRSTLHQEQRSWATLRASAKIPTLNTKLVTSYGWTDFRALLPVHYSLTEKTYQDMGWNAYIRQPLPIFGGLPGRLEISAEILNLLAQGYLPIQANGRRSILTNSPRALRGGLSIIF